MSNETKLDPTVTVELGGAIRTFSFSMYSLHKLQKLTGKNAFRGEIDTKDFEQMTAFVWAGLIDRDPTLDGAIVDGKPDEKLGVILEQISKWISLDKLTLVSEAIATAFSYAMPKRKEGEVKK